MPKKGELIFPDVPKLLKPELIRVHKTQGRTQAAIAGLLKISSGTFSEMVNGLAQLPEAKITDLMKYLAPEEPDVFEAKLRKAITSSKPHYDTVLKRLRAGLALNVSNIDYYPFSGGGVIESIFNHFAALAGIKCNPTGNRRGFTHEDYLDSDILLGLFDSADRMLTLDLKFWRVPIRMGLGAVCHQIDEKHAGTIADIISKPRANGNALSPVIRPIVATNDIGMLHCQKRLCFAQ